MFYAHDKYKQSTYSEAEGKQANDSTVEWTEWSTGVRQNVSKKLLIVMFQSVQLCAPASVNDMEQVPA